MAHNTLKHNNTEVYLRPGALEIVHRGIPGNTRQTMINNFNNLHLMKFEDYEIIKETGNPDSYYNLTLKVKKTRDK